MINTIKTQLKDAMVSKDKKRILALRNILGMLKLKEIDKKGKIDIVVNTAAINFCKKIDEIGIEEWDEVVCVNLRSAFLVCQQASIRMKKQKYGKIVFQMEQCFMELKIQNYHWYNFILE